MYDVAIIGFGRVGAPLSLSLEKNGLSVVAIDISKDIINKVNNKIMPFNEPGYDELLLSSKIQVFDGNEIEKYPEAKCYIITVGTPLMQQIETDLSQIKRVIKTLIDKVDIKNKLVVLRSTVAPYTTEFVKNYISSTCNLKFGDEFYLAMCPERIAEGKALIELEQLPQIIGVSDEISFMLAQDVFSVLKVDILKCTYIEAELAKLFCNIYRYINFAIPNYFTYIADKFKVDIFKLLNVMNLKYPRNSGLKYPGFAAGACLRKDFGMINEYFPQTDLLLQAHKINEYMPKFYTDLVKDKINGKRIGILGYTFKSNTDDTRDSLVPKMIRYIERQVPSNILIHEPNLPQGQYCDKFNEYSFDNKSLDDVIQNSDIIFIAINHNEFSKLNASMLKEYGCKTIVDIWGILNLNELVIN